MLLAARRLRGVFALLIGDRDDAPGCRLEEVEADCAAAMIVSSAPSGSG